MLLSKGGWAGVCGADCRGVLMDGVFINVELVCWDCNASDVFERRCRYPSRKCLTWTNASPQTSTLVYRVVTTLASEFDASEGVELFRLDANKSSVVRTGP